MERQSITKMPRDSGSRAEKLPVLMPYNCAVREFTADGVSVGRCWHYVGLERTCPRHGDVSVVQDHYAATGELTDER